MEYVNLVGRRVNLQLPSTLVSGACLCVCVAPDKVALLLAGWQPSQPPLCVLSLALQVFDYPTTAAVTGFLAAKLAARQAAAAPAVAAPQQAVMPGLAFSATPARAAPAISIRATVLCPLMSAPAAGAQPITPGLTVPQHDAIQPIPAARWSPDAPGAAAPDIAGAVAAIRFGAFLRDADQFDAAAFGLSGPEALVTDPQHRLLLASAAQLLATPGAFAAAGSMSDTGVFIGISWTEYHQLSKTCGQPVGASTAQGAVLSVACGRWVSAGAWLTGTAQGACMQLHDAGLAGLRRVSSFAGDSCQPCQCTHTGFLTPLDSRAPR